MSTFRMAEADDNVEMTPAYISAPEHIVAPRLTAWNQSVIIRWRKERDQYERRLHERCVSTSEQYDSIVVSVCGSVDAVVLKNLAAYVLHKERTSITDQDVIGEVNRRCTTVKTTTSQTWKLCLRSTSNGHERGRR
ncbi:unnamed protein product [Peronospora destructor]|uniref:Uncharacterized protein n=1 Tax=Peronospora destructor TaxID=86335 RepID=A0AAV0VCQ1_9STRA|nr:unnamed protein product [Peronospora destructor]